MVVKNGDLTMGENLTPMIHQVPTIPSSTRFLAGCSCHFLEKDSGYIISPQYTIKQKNITKALNGTS